MLAMEGQRAFRFQIDFRKNEEIIDHKNVIYVELNTRLTAAEFCQFMCYYGDVYVIKDSAQGYFVEFNWVDDKRNPNCKSCQDICAQMKEDQVFGTYSTRN
jgi:hypothetical protein